jgi:hypothetical protein
MTHNIVKIVLVILCIVVGYLCYNTIAKTLREQQQIAEVEGGVINRLNQIKEAQFAYKEAYGSFATTFDSLVWGVRNGRIADFKQVGELVDSSSKVQIDTIYVPVTERLKGKIGPLDSLRYVPYSNKTEFSLKAGEIVKNGIALKVFEAKDPQPYNKKRALKIGSMDDAIFTGNWEKQEK